MKLVSRNSRCEERMGIMTKEELIAQTVEKYTNLQRIMKAADPRKEMENQKRVLEVMLQAMGVVTEKQEIEWAVPRRWRGGLFGAKAAP